MCVIAHFSGSVWYFSVARYHPYCLILLSPWKSKPDLKPWTDGTQPPAKYQNEEIILPYALLASKYRPYDYESYLCVNMCHVAVVVTHFHMFISVVALSASELTYSWMPDTVLRSSHNRSNMVINDTDVLHSHSLLTFYHILYLNERN